MRQLKPILRNFLLAFAIIVGAFALYAAAKAIVGDCGYKYPDHNDDR